jgi:hypothetical protein
MTPTAFQRFIAVAVPFRTGEAAPQIAWDGSRLVRTLGSNRDEITLDLSGDEVALVAQGTREAGGYSFRSSSTGNVAMKFAATEDQRQLVGVWRDTVGPLAVAHRGADLVLSAGENEWRAESARQTAQLAVDITVDGKPVVAPMQAMRTVDDGVLAWGTVPEEGEGAFRCQAMAGDGVVVRLGQRRLQPGEMVWLTAGEPFSIRGARNPLTARIALQSLVQDATPVVAEIVPEASAGRRIEAESFAAFGNGRAKVYSHRTFLSNGKGLETEVRPGQWVEWRFATDHAQRLAVVVKAAVFEDNAQRLVELDGQPLGGAYRIHQLPATGGFGATPEQWQHVRLGSAIVPAGEHVLRLTTVARKANLDYLLLVPMP